MVQKAFAAAEEHMRTGRMLIMDDVAKEMLMENAKQFEIRQYGRTIDRTMMPHEKSKPPKSLFD